MADYTALVEAGSALVELLRDNLTPEPISNRELIALCSPHESESRAVTTRWDKMWSACAPPAITCAFW